jgi:hypothetical protein
MARRGFRIRGKAERRPTPSFGMIALSNDEKRYELLAIINQTNYFVYSNKNIRLLVHDP